MATYPAHLPRKYQKPEIDLALAVLCAWDEENERPVTPPGTRRSIRELGDICNCRWQNIWRIEQVALRKLRNRLHFIKDPILMEAVEMVIGRKPTHLLQ